MQKEKSSTGQSEGNASRFYRCESNLRGCFYITTNDAELADQLIKSGAKIICHPSFFNPGVEYDSRLIESVPYVVRTRNRQENLDPIYYPSDKHESSLAITY